MFLVLVVPLDLLVLMSRFHVLYGPLLVFNGPLKVFILTLKIRVFQRGIKIRIEEEFLAIDISRKLDNLKAKTLNSYGKNRALIFYVYFG